MLTNKRIYIQLFIYTTILSIISNTSDIFIKTLENPYIKTPIQLLLILFFTIAAYVNLYFYQRGILKHSSQKLSDIPIAPIKEAVFNYIKVLASQLLVAFFAIVVLIYGIISSISTHEKIVLYFIFIMLAAVVFVFLLFWFLRLTFIGNIIVLKGKQNKAKEIIHESKVIIRKNIKELLFIYLINILVIAISFVFIKLKFRHWSIIVSTNLLSIITTFFSTIAFTTIFVKHIENSSSKTDDRIVEEKFV